MTAAKPLSAAIGGERSHGSKFRDYKTCNKNSQGQCNKKTAYSQSKPSFCYTVIILLLQ